MGVCQMKMSIYRTLILCFLISLLMVGNVFAGAMTVGAWVKPNGSDEIGYILSKTQNVDYGFGLWWSGNTNRLVLYFDGVDQVVSSNSVFVDDDVWVFVTLTKDASGNVAFYRNGVPAGTKTGAIVSDNSHQLRIGCRDGSGGFFDGSIQSPFIYNRALSAGEVANLYNSQKKTILRTDIVGVEWNQNTDTWRHIDINSNTLTLDTAYFDQHPIWGNIKRCNMDATGDVLAYRGDETYKNDGSNGYVMVEIPATYVKTANPSANVYRWWVSPSPQPNFVLHYAFPQGGDGNYHYSDHVYMGAYEAGFDTDHLLSQSGVQPKVDTTIAGFQTYAGNIGDGWNITNFWELALIRLLYYIEYADADSQTTIGRGIVDKPSGTGFAGELTGADGIDNNLASNGTGSGTGTDGLTPIAYRWIENLWGNAWQFITGYDAIDATYNLAKIDGTSSLTSPLTTYSSSTTAPITVDEYQSNLLYETNLEFAFLPSSASGGSSSTYMYDYLWAHNAGETNVLLFGGTWTNSADAGAGSLYSIYEASVSSRSRGCRLSFLKP